MKNFAQISSFEFETASRTHQGNVRKFNEDSIFTNPNVGIWLVADGMGGHNDGNVASSMIAEAVSAFGEADKTSNLVHDFQLKINSVNRRLLAISNGDDALLVGSTVVALIIAGDTFSCLWAGDSRCYLIRAGSISQVSHDHTEVQELVDRGTISPQEAKTWPRRNVITRAVGADDGLQLEIVSGIVRHGDSFILCSDGLTGHVSDVEIQETAQWSRSDAACDKLVEMALDRGGKDNVSVIVVHASSRDKTTIVQR